MDYFFPVLSLELTDSDMVAYSDILTVKVVPFLLALQNASVFTLNLVCATKQWSGLGNVFIGSGLS